MCCADEEQLGLPAAAVEMVARYRRLRAEQGFGWGEDAFPEMFGWARFARLGPAFDEYAASGDWAGAVRAAVGGSPPAGLVLVVIDEAGAITVRTGPARPVIDGAPTQIDVVAVSDAGHAVTVAVQEQGQTVPAGGAAYWVLDLTAATADISVSCGDVVVNASGAVAPTPAATLRLTSPDGARWSVTDATGGAWFAPGTHAKWDAADAPYFHTGPGAVELPVPAGPVHVRVVRGLEFVPVTTSVRAQAGETAEVAYPARRRFDPAAAGWYGADLHVHLNYSGDHVLHPVDAARMQRAEGLHLMHLTAGNLGGSLVYDLELLESTAGADLWHDDDLVARAGLEFRNALLGHVHGFGLTAAPTLRHTGDEGTEHPWDWPPNAAACTEMRELGAVTSYAHPVYEPGADAAVDPEALFRPFRMVEARELVVDAALGVVDGMELASCFDDRGALVLYHHLLSCGLRLAATAGTDAFLSFARGPAPASNPPGWCRVYAHLDGGLRADAFTHALRAGRTLVTNGPWLTFAVDGHGPGTVLDHRAGTRVTVSARVDGPAVDRLVLYGPDGELAATEGTHLEHELVIDTGTWVAAAAHGPVDPHTGAPLFAHTTPVYVDVDGRRVARAASARWCRGLLDGLAAAAREHGRFDPADREHQLGALDQLIGTARAHYGSIAATGVRQPASPR